MSCTCVQRESTVTKHLVQLSVSDPELFAKSGSIKDPEFKIYKKNLIIFSDPTHWFNLTYSDIKIQISLEQQHLFHYPQLNKESYEDLLDVFS